MNNKKIFPYLLLIALAILVFFVKNCKSNNHTKTDTNTATTNEHRGLNRNPSQINYSKHARCRMDCRHIDETEVKDILQNGKVNYKRANSMVQSAERSMLLKATVKTISI